MIIVYKTNVCLKYMLNTNVVFCSIRVDVIFVIYIKLANRNVCGDR